MHSLQILIFWGSAIYHLVMGAFCLLSLENLRKLSRFLYALKVPENVDPRFEYGLRPLGAFALSLSAICFWAALCGDEKFQTFFALNLCALFALRALFRIFYRDLFFRAFAVPFRRSLSNIVFNFLLILLLLLTVQYR